MKNKFLPPYIKSGVSTRSLALDVFIAAIPLVGMAVFFYGIRALAVCLISVVTAIGCELAVCVFTKKRITVFDGTAALTGLIIGLLCPVSIPYPYLVLASAFAILVAKLPFGGRGRNPFNPAAAGFAFLALSAPEVLFKYPSIVSKKLSLAVSPSYEPAQSLTGLLKDGGLLPRRAFELFVGRFSGPLGTTFLLVVFACGAYLLYRRVASGVTSVSFLAGCAAFALLFPRVNSPGFSVLLELGSGSLLFCAFFMVTDPTTSPKTAWGRVFFGLTAGTATMLFRYYGVYEQGAPFGILIANAAVPLFDQLYWKIRKEVSAYEQRKLSEKRGERDF